jgi:cyclopropane fatty-acyl-phospholipid synthase-like methyltransferase
MIRTIDPPNPDLPDSDYPAGSAEWWDERYRSGDIPWDTGVVPPEVVALFAGGQVRPGWALDLGCGSGLSSRYLASQGFRVVGLDLALRALVRAASAARTAALPAFFCLADVTQLEFLDLRASFALDVGCFHAVAPDRRPAYVASLAARLVPGAFYLLYAFTLSATGEEGPQGISPVDIGRFAPDFVLRWVQHGRDQERPSAWYLLQRS